MPTTTKPETVSLTAKYKATYCSWQSMKARCTNPNRPQYRHYGGKGIKVCARWFNSFANFLADLGPRPPSHTIDRIDPNRDYEPGNCRWVHKSVQPSTRASALSTALCFVCHKKRGKINGRCRSCNQYHWRHGVERPMDLITDPYHARGSRVTAKPCVNCGRPVKRKLPGRCIACSQYFRKYGKERPPELAQRPTWIRRKSPVDRGPSTPTPVTENAVLPPAPTPDPVPQS